MDLSTVDRRLIITADDFGLWPSYDEGILEAVRANAIDAVSVMVRRVEALPGELQEWGGAVGVHLEAESAGLLGGEVGEQVDSLARLLGRVPDYVDGHHHCHTEPEVAGEVAALAAAMDLAVRSVGDEHRALLRTHGVRTPDRFIGRYEEWEPVLPAELSCLRAGWTEWMVHPGCPGEGSGSSYDAGRVEDLEMLLELELPAGVVRGSHRELPTSEVGDPQ